MKKTILLYLAIILTFISCNNSTKRSEITEIGKIIEKFHLAPLTVNIEEVHQGEIKDKRGKTRKVAYILNASCKFSYDLKKIEFDKETGRVTLPTCEVTIATDPSSSSNSYFYIGGEYDYDLKAINEFKKGAKNAIYKKLKEDKYEEKAFMHATKLLNEYLNKFETSQKIDFKKNNNPIMLVQ